MKFAPLCLPRMIIGNFQHADWKRARRGGTWVCIKEFILALTGFNTWPFFIPMASGWDERRIRTLLKAKGVTCWAFGYWNGEMHFSTEKRQGAWGQYVMLRAGVPLLHGHLTGSRANPQIRRQESVK